MIGQQQQLQNMAAFVLNTMKQLVVGVLDQLLGGGGIVCTAVTGTQTATRATCMSLRVTAHKQASDGASEACLGYIESAEQSRTAEHF